MNDQTTLRAAYVAVLGGVSACSPERYENSLRLIAKMVERELDDTLRAEIRVIEHFLPCNLD